MEYLVLVLIMMASAGAIFLVYRKFTKHTYPEITGNILQSLVGLEKIGLFRQHDRLQGLVHNYPVSVFATTSLKRYGPLGGEKIQVMVAISTGSDKVKQLAGLPSDYFVQGQTDTYAYILFIVDVNTSADVTNSVELKLDRLIHWLKENRFEPYR